MHARPEDLVAMLAAERVIDHQVDRGIHRHRQMQDQVQQGQSHRIQIPVGGGKDAVIGAMMLGVGLARGHQSRR